MHEIQNQILTSKSGYQILYRYTPFSALFHVAGLVNAGSCHETAHENGITHLIEHLVFKGTRKRSAFALLNALESLGGEINAYTTKEKTCFYASVRKEHARHAIDVICDIVLNPTFPDRELSKEKQVIAEEIDMYLDNPEESIHDDFEGVLLNGSSLALPILGTHESLANITPEHIQAYYATHYHPGNILFACSGNIRQEDVLKYFDRYLPNRKRIRKTSNVVRLGPAVSTAITKATPHHQAHLMLGNIAYKAKDKRYIALMVLNNLIGGPAMSSQLNMKVREQHALAYSVYSFYNPYLTGGSWGIYAGCEKKHLTKVRSLITEVLLNACSQPLSARKLRQLQEQTIGQMAMHQENLLSQLLAHAKDQQDFGRTFSFQEIAGEIMKVSSEQLVQVANEVMHPNLLLEVNYLPRT